MAATKDPGKGRHRSGRVNQQGRGATTERPQETAIDPAVEAQGSTASSLAGAEGATEAPQGVENMVGAIVDEVRAVAARGDALVGAGTGQQLVGAAEAAEIDDELARGGPAFGAFVKAVGLAVAESQAKLDETFAATAEKLSKTEINTVAVYEQKLNDETGQMEAGTPLFQKLPLVNFVMPTLYAWERVYLQADMQVAEFNTKNGFNIQGKRESGGLGGGLGFGPGGFGFTLGGSFQTSNFQRSGEFATSVDTAAGQLHMEATLEPRDDVRLPQPFVVQKGPQLKLEVGSRQDILQDSNQPAGPTNPVVGTKVELTATLTKSDGSGNANRTLDVRLDNGNLGFKLSGPTNANGKATITVERKGAGIFVLGETIESAVRVSFGLVTATRTIVL
jgi:hypothetical protein